MQNAITTLRIQNFKSIKDVTMTPRRVNIIIGEPNVGKSNILEAMSLLGGMVYDQTPKFMAGMIRYEEPNQLYYDNLSANTICVESNHATSIIRAGRFPGTSQVLYVPASVVEALYNEQSRRMRVYRNSYDLWAEAFNEILRTGKPGGNALDGLNMKFGFRTVRIDGGMPDGELGFEKSSIGIEREVFVRPYLFHKNVAVGKDYGVKFLFPPNGTNLKNIIQNYPALRKQVAEMFQYYKLKLSLRMVSAELEVIKEVDDLVYSYPYSNTADTLQRLIFYLAAIESNDDAVLLFEEPEAHSYPVYVSQLARRIVASRNNQFFVVTHSPYLITEVLEEMMTNDELAPELAMFVTYYEDYQTKVRQLSDEEMRNIRRDGLDVFYNMARFVPQR